MGGSRKKSTVGPAILCHMVDEMAYPDRTPGILGDKDAGDPTKWSLLGDTPGPTGVNDCGAPGRYVLSGMNTFHDWALEQQFHLPVNDQTASLFPGGRKQEVLTQATTFLIESEAIEEHPYLPVSKDGTVIGQSGITIGIGYDLGQHSEKKIRHDWAELDTRSQPPRPSPEAYSLGVPELKIDDSLKAQMPPPENQIPSKSYSLPKLTLDPVWLKPSPVDLLAGAANLKRQKAKDYLPKVKHLIVFKDIVLKVFKETMLPEYYDQATRFFPGMIELPTGVQVALVSLVFNSGRLHKKEQHVLIEPGQKVPALQPSPSKSLGLNLHGPANGAGSSLHRSSRITFGLKPLQLGPAKGPEKTPEPAMVEIHEEDFFGGDWEKRQLREAVRTKDLVWIYWYFESSRRVWAKEKALVKRRNDEASLIFPYVAADLQREAFMRRFQNL